MIAWWYMGQEMCSSQCYLCWVGELVLCVQLVLHGPQLHTMHMSLLICIVKLIVAKMVSLGSSDHHAPLTLEIPGNSEAPHMQMVLLPLSPELHSRQSSPSLLHISLTTLATCICCISLSDS